MMPPRKPKQEIVPLRGTASLVVRESSATRFNYPWHAHREVELTWIGRGSGLRFVGHTIAPFHAGELCLIGSDLPHAWLSPAGPAPGGVHSVVVQFDPARWGTTFFELKEMRAIGALLTRADRGLRFTRRTLKNAVERLRDELAPERSPLRRLTLLLEVLALLANDTTALPLTTSPWPNRRRPPDPRIGKTLSYLKSNYAEAVSQATVAARIGMTAPAFSRFFHRAVGKTFVGYLTELRLGEACRLLRETDLPITEVAYAVGFGNLSNFNRCFRLAHELSPRRFRQETHAALE